ncbi:MAG: tetratricopeptide repeat protein [Bacteroidetes bacterium]|nr:tetratricopeptide repeat protein [Bacteroidota bacterium]
MTSKPKKISQSRSGTRVKQPAKQYTVKKPLFEDPRFLAAVIVVLTFIAFFPSLKNTFITTWDDNAYVTENHYIRELNFQSLKLMFTKQVNGTYVPLPLITYAIEYKLFGVHPLPYHITNLLIHLVCTLLVFQLLRLLKINLILAAAGALLFGIHPMRVESVVWIAERKDVLYSLFYLAALVMHVKFIRGGEKATTNYRLTLLFFFLALLSKIEAVTLPLSLLLIDYYLERPLKFRLIAEKIPHFLLSFFFGCLGIFILFKVGLLTVNKILSFSDRFFYGLFALNAYVVKFLFPYQQSAVYPYPVSPGNALPLFYYLNPLLTLLMIFLVYRTVRRTRAVVFGALFFLVNVIFLLQIFAAGSAFLADRYTYVAYFGLIFMAVWGADQLITKKAQQKQLILTGMGVYLIVFMVLTWNRCETWKNDISLWTDVIEKYPGKSVASYSNRGIAYTQEGQWDNALADFTKAIAVDPKYPVSFANRGMVYGNLGRVEDAISDFTKAIEIDTAYTLVYHNRGVTYGSLGQYDKAISDLKRAVKLKPGYISAYSNLGLIYCQMNLPDSAIRIGLEGLNKNPQSADLLASLGNSYLLKSDVENAGAYYRKCLETSDRNIDALLGMAVVSYLKNEIAYANGYINQAQSIEPVLNEGMAGVEKLEQAGYSFTAGKKEILSKIFSQMK